MKTSKTMILMFMLCLIFIPGLEAYAEGSDEYITITVDAEDDNEGLLYSIDSTEDSAFTGSNTFTIPAGTSHTIYVKDAAGNITSQDYSPGVIQSSPGSSSLDIPVNDGDTQDINIDVELGNKDYSSILGTSSPAEPGEGTMYNRTVTDGSDSDSSEKIFYTVTTKEGDTFYMVIDKNQNTDNVYLLDTVKRSDLAALAVDDKAEQQKEGKEEDNLLTALQNEKEEDMPAKTAASPKEKGISPKFIVLIIVLIVGGGYYYLKIYKNKKDEQMDVMDAMDMGDFAVEEDEDEEDEAEFDLADDEKEAFLDNLINEDEESELYDADPDDYADPDENGYGDNEIVADFETEYDPDLDGSDFDEEED